jgi:hypothetical protein
MTEVASELNKSTTLQVSCSVLSRKPKLIAYDTYCHTSDFCVHECMHVHVNLVYTKPPCSCVVCVSHIRKQVLLPLLKILLIFSYFSRKLAFKTDAKSEESVIFVFFYRVKVWTVMSPTKMTTMTSKYSY